MNFPPSESSAYFNPRSREGSDNICSKTGLVIQDFNPRSREGSDWVRAFLCALFEIFQSTLPRGERRSQLIGFMISKYFNPRSREGSDTERNCRYGRSSRFQSTLPRGERRERSQKKRTAQTFQSTLPRGERLLLLPCSVPPFSISIHAPARGATWHTRYPQKSDQFQSTLPRGERQNRKQKGDFAQKFQSTLPRGERLDKV